MTTNFLTDKETLEALNKENKRLIKKNNSHPEKSYVSQPNSSSGSDTNNKILQENKVFIERAGKLDKERIRAVCGTDEEFSKYVDKITNKIPKKIEEKVFDILYDEVGNKLYYWKGTCDMVVFLDKVKQAISLAFEEGKSSILEQKDKWKEEWGREYKNIGIKIGQKQKVDDVLDEFIKELKIEIKENLNVPPMCQDRILSKIDKLAGVQNGKED